MADQTSYLNSIGLKAKSLTSANSSEENYRIQEDFKQGKLKILYVSPERMMKIHF